jgi:hypothetical protein
MKTPEACFAKCEANSTCHYASFLKLTADKNENQCGLVQRGAKCSFIPNLRYSLLGRIAKKNQTLRSAAWTQNQFVPFQVPFEPNASDNFLSKLIG